MWAAESEIEVDSGRYDCCDEHEPALEWYRIRRVGDRVEVLHFETGGGNDPAEARKVRVERAEMNAGESRDLLRDLGWIAAARLEPRESESVVAIWCLTWSFVRISEGVRTAWEDAWAGMDGSYDEHHSAKARACVERIDEAVSEARVEPFEPSVRDRMGILDALSRRSYAGKPWTAFARTEPLTDLYRRLVLELGGEPAGCLPPPREVVEFRVGPAGPVPNVREHVTIRTVSGDEVAIAWWSCPTDPMTFGCWTVRLEPGEYVAVLDALEYEPRRFPLTVRPGERATVELELVKREQRR